MPDTTENQEDFPQQGGQKPGLGFPICRVVGVTDLFSGLLVNAAIGQFSGKDSGEQSLLRELLPSFEAGDIILGDAFFPTWFFMANMLANGVDILMEQQGARKRSTDFRTGKKLGVRDHLIVLTKPVIQPSWMTRAQYESYSDAITVRELKANKKTMVTTMLCPAAMPKAVLADLYKRRWHVEVDIRCIKDTLGMNILSCKTPEMVIKEIWTYLLAYNLIRLIMAQSALMGDIAPRQISFKHSVQLWLAWLQQAGTWEDEKLIILCELIVQQQVGRRPGRLEPRAVKRRPKAYPLLMKPRAEAREDVRKFGHAKKLK